MAQVVECLPSKHEALSSNSSFLTHTHTHTHTNTHTHTHTHTHGGGGGGGGDKVHEKY
jgi:hypothetical protein